MEESKKITEKIRFFIIEDFYPRPVKEIPDEILKSVQQSQVGILAMQGKKGELENFRRPLLKQVNNSQIRFANMININQKIMREGMNANYKEIQKFSNKIYNTIKNSSQIKVKTKLGTNLTAEFDPSIRWVIGDGNIKAGNWKNLPDGEVFTCPYIINGTAIIDGVLGDHFSKKYGTLQNSPLYLKIEKGFIKQAKCKNKTLEKEFNEKIATDENSSRIGEFAIGTNLFIKELIGNMLQDEKFPGIHIAAGNGYPEKTGSDCSSAIHIDGIIRKPDIVVDGKMIMKEGGFLV